MKKKLVLSGIAVLVLAMGFVFTACEEEPTDGKIVIGSNSEHYPISRIKILNEENGTAIDESVSLSKGESKSWTLPIGGTYKFSVEAAHEGAAGGKVEVNSDILEDRTFSFSEGVKDQEITRILYARVQEETTVAYEEGIHFFWDSEFRNSDFWDY